MATMCVPEKILDLLVISRGNGAPGIVTGFAVNEGAEPLEMQVVAEDASPLGRSITLPPGRGVRLDGGDAGLDGGPEVEPLDVKNTATFHTASGL